jgi:hypothetical protein
MDQTHMAVSYIAVKAKLQILGKPETFDTSNIAQVEEPNICQDLAFPDVPRNNSAENINFYVQVGGSAH